MSAHQHAVRSRPDLCPGVMAVHQAADGGLARVRLPGGVLTATQLRVLSAAAADLGDGQLELTSRANLQVRGLAPGSERQLSQRLYDAGLLPSLTHERVRNILASPLSGLDERSLYDVLPVAAELDRSLCASAGLAELPGRFLFTLDDGRGDLDGIDADAGVRAANAGVAVLRLAGADTGVRVAWAGVPQVLTAVADAFLAERAAQGSSGWRLAELDDGPARVTERLGAESIAVPPAETLPTETPPTGTPPRAGTHRQSDGRVAVVAAVPLGRLTVEQAGAVGRRDGGRHRHGPDHAVAVGRRTRTCCRRQQTHRSRAGDGSGVGLGRDDRVCGAAGVREGAGRRTGRCGANAAVAAARPAGALVRL